MPLLAMTVLVRRCGPYHADRQGRTVGAMVLLGMMVPVCWCALGMLTVSAAPCW